MNKRIHTLALALLLAFAATAVAQISNIPQFSADMNMTAPGGRKSAGRIFWGSGRIRMDMNAEGQEVSLVQDLARKTSYMIMHQQHMYMEMGADNPMGQRMRTPDVKPYDLNNPCASEPGYTCKKVGVETVNGRTCDKWEFKGPHGDRTVWVDQKLHFPIRAISPQSGPMELTNVQEGPQSASRFEIPSGYNKMEMGGMMGGRKPQQ